MRAFASLMVLVVLFGTMADSQTSAATGLGLKPEQIPAECKAVDGYFPIDIQTAILWQKTDLYKSLIPLPVSKSAQSFMCQGNKGTAYFFQFGNEADRKTAAASIDKSQEVILYCGCCPWEHCPNVAAAWRTLKELGFTNLKVLYIPKNFGADWVEKGYPVVKG